MNQVELIGRFAKDIELRMSQEGNAIVRTSMAVPREGKKDEADFVSLVAFGKTAEFLAKWLGKGLRSGIIGRIRTGSYTNQQGDKVYTTDVIVDKVFPIDWKKELSEDQKQERLEESFGENLNITTDDLPFSHVY